MTVRRHLRAAKVLSFWLLAMLWLLAVRPQLHLFSGLGKLLLSVIIATLLLFVAHRSAHLCRSLLNHLQATLVLLFAFVSEQKSFLQAHTADFNPAEPVQPFRFQRPPPSLA